MMRLLDLFCGGGGASVGYVRAGFDDIVGIDIVPQPHYPFSFICADALTWLAMAIADGTVAQFDLIHASPPCQLYSPLRSLTRREHLVDLIAPTRSLLLAAGVPYVIENVPNAPLLSPVMLCGTMFGLAVIRHRHFETSWGEFFAPATCCHDGAATGSGTKKHGGTPGFAHGYSYITVAGHAYLADEGRAAMGIDWLPRSRLSQAIPPAYTEYLARRWLGSMNPDKPPARVGGGSTLPPASNRGVIITPLPIGIGG